MKSLITGNSWKSVQTRRSSSASAHKKGWTRQQKERKEREILQLIKKEQQQEKQQELEMSKKLKAERLERKLANERKAEVIQKV